MEGLLACHIGHGLVVVWDGDGGDSEVTDTGWCMQGMLTHVMLAMGIPATVVLCYGLLVVIQPGTSYFDPRYVVPLLSLLLAALIHAISTALSTVFQELTAGMAIFLFGNLHTGSWMLDGPNRGHINPVTKQPRSPTLHSPAQNNNICRQH